LLLTIKPISSATNKSFFQKYPLLLPFVTIGLMGAVYLSNNKIVVGVSGIALTAFMVWAFYKIQTSQEIDGRIKRKSYWILLVIVSVSAIIYYKIFGG
jgi:hypothetical protein